MNRIPKGGYAELISEGFKTVGPIADRLRHANFFTGTDPVWAGLEQEYIEGPYGERHMMHCSYPWHTTDRSTTIVVPTMRHPSGHFYKPWAIVHELGHVLDAQLEFKFTPIKPVTWYGETNRLESFAEFFAMYFLKDTVYRFDDQDTFHADKEMIALIERLAEERIS